MSETTTKETTQSQYEGMFLLGQNAASDLDGSVKLVRGIIERHGGQVLVLKKWDERKLLYEIESQKRGTYILSYFNAPSASIVPIERDVRLSEEVLRVLVTKADHLNQKEMEAVEPQPIIREERPSWERDDRPPRRDDRGPRDDRPRDDRPRDDRPSNDRPSSDRPSNDRPRDDRAPVSRPPRREEGTPENAGYNKD